MIYYVVSYVIIRSNSLHTILVSVQSLLSSRLHHVHWSITMSQFQQPGNICFFGRRWKNADYCIFVAKYLASRDKENWQWKCPDIAIYSILVYEENNRGKKTPVMCPIIYGHHVSVACTCMYVYFGTCLYDAKPFIYHVYHVPLMYSGIRSLPRVL